MDKVKLKHIILILVPLVIDYVTNLMISVGINSNKGIILTAASTLMMLWKYLSVAYWFYVGRVFYGDFAKPIVGFVIGNSLWLVLLVMYIFQFYIAESPLNNGLLTILSQCYMVGFVQWSSWIVGMFASTIVSTTVTIGAYLLMLLTFTLGFISKRQSIRKARYS